jgi:hypothetical protein
MKKRKNNKKPLHIALLSGLVLLATTSTVWFVRRDTNNMSTIVPLPAPSAEESINLEPPTEQDKQVVDQQKQDISKNEQQTTPLTPSGKVTPVITYAGQYDQDKGVEVAARVPGVFEDKGICKISLMRGLQTIVRETEGFKDFRDTVCIPATIPMSDFPETGDWTVVVSYVSTTSSGTSSPTVIRVD